MKALFLILVFSFLISFCLADQYTQTSNIIPSLSGVIVFNQQQTPDFTQIYTNLTSTGTGDSEDMTVGILTATYGYLSFSAPVPAEGYYLQNASLNLHIFNNTGNGVLGVYPIFNINGNTYSPDCLLQHVDYGASLTASDLNTPLLHPSEILINTFTMGWVTHNVTSWVQADMDTGRTNNQFRLMLDGTSDWDYYSDGIGIHAGTNFTPYIEYTFVSLPGVLTGFVRDAYTLQPIANAVVSCDTFSAVTNQNGRYQLSLPMGEHQITCSCDSLHISQTLTVTINPGQSQDMSFALQRRTGFLFGDVTDSITHQLIPGAVITCEGQTVTTNTEGSYILTLPYGSHNLTCTYNQYYNHTETAEVIADEYTVLNFQLEPVGIEDETEVTTELLLTNSPNPFVSQTRISYTVKVGQQVSIDIYNQKGQLIRRLVGGYTAKGKHSMIWDGKDKDGKDMGSGVYVCRMRVGTENKVSKMLLIK